MDEALIKLKVKTLDSQNHEFTVDNEVRSLKRNILKQAISRTNF